MKKILSEFLATFFLVFAGTGAIVINQESGGAISHLGIAITFGLVVTAMIYAFAGYSGAHMNPAVTIALAIGNKFPAKEIPLYIISQLAGAFAASALLKVLFPANISLGATLPSGSNMQSFVLELLLTFFLMFTVLSTAKQKNYYAPIAIGFVVLLEALFAGPICGASMNPARSLAPAMLSAQYSSIWIYLTAPVIGAITAMFTFKFMEK
ncbi:MAG TPA: MIP family channel protein [Bacteroidia bacterium]|jgi:aquaporin Z